MKNNITPEKLGEMMKDAKKSKCYKLYAAHQKDDQARIRVEKRNGST